MGRLLQSVPSDAGWTGPSDSELRRQSSWMATGQTATLKWSVAGATTLTADTNHVLTATNQYGSTQAQATLWVGGELPPGLVLSQDGTLSGTPTAAGTYTVAVSVVDDSAPTQLIDGSFKLAIH
jgi:hypothetical protein